MSLTRTRVLSRDEPPSRVDIRAGTDIAPYAAAMHRLHSHWNSGITLIELMIVVVILGIMVALAAPMTVQWASNQRLTQAARQVESAFSYARSEAIRTGNIHIVMVDEEPDGTDLDAPIVVLNDGRAGTIGQNCAIDSGENVELFTLEPDVSLGADVATTQPATDTGGGTFPGIATFLDADGVDATWVMLRPEGFPLAVSWDCDMGAAGSGGGGVYLTNGERDVAIVLTPLGATLIHTSNAAGGWSQ